MPLYDQFSKKKQPVNEVKNMWLSFKTEREQHAHKLLVNASMEAKVNEALSFVGCKVKDRSMLVRSQGQMFLF